MKPNPKPRLYCKICGAKLRYDTVGPYCPTKNCEWHQGLPTKEGGLYKK